MNRNRVKSPQGTNWLTVPVKGAYKNSIEQMEVDNSTPWAEKHISTLKQFYAKSAYTGEIAEFEKIIRQDYKKLSDLTIATTGFFLDTFSIKTRRKTQSQFNDLPNNPNLRIIEIGKRIGANTYLAGGGSKSYMDIDLFSDNGIEVKFMDSLDVVYPQLYSDFIPNLGSIDLLLNQGRDGFEQYIKPLLRSL